MKTAFLFNGQGAQFAGMGKDFYQAYPQIRGLFDDAAIDFDLKEVCFSDNPEKLNNTAYTQSCIAAVSSAIASLLREKGIQADYAAGLSLGEYSALAFAGVIHPQDLLQLVRKRGLIMAQALPEGTTGMAAVLRPDVEAVKEVCAKVEMEGECCRIANYNSPRQVVITGTNAGLEKAAALLKEKKMPCKFLTVSGAFHSPLLKEASDQLEEVLAPLEFHAPSCPVVFNVTASMEHDDIKQLLKKQICSPVLFWQSIETLADEGVDTFVEIGPGKTLGKLVKQIVPEAVVYSVSSVQDLEDLVKEFENGK